MPRRKIIIFVIIAIIFAGLAIRYLDRVPKRNYCDFRVYYATGVRFAQKADIYTRPDEAITPFKYSPMFAMLMGPLSIFPIKAASLVFFTVSFISLILAFIFSAKLIVRDEISFRQSVFLHISTALCGLRFVLHTLDSGQVSIMIFALVILGLYFLRKNKTAFGAAFVGLTVMFKYMPAVFLPYFLFKKKIKVILFMLIFIMLFCVVPATYVGMEKNADYLKGWVPNIIETSLDQNSFYDYKNQSLFSFSLRYFGADSPYKISAGNLTFNQAITIAGFAGIIIYLLIIIPGRNYDLSEVIDYSLLFICMALFNPNAWMHNFVFYIFAYMTLFYHLIKVNFRDRITLVLIVISFALTNLTSELFVGDTLKSLFEELSAVTIGGLILMFLLFRLKFQKQRGT